MPEQPIIWAYAELRGAWCTDCFNVWRTIYSGHHSLTLFSKHLKVSTENQHEFEVFLVAFLSIKLEGDGKITGPMIQARAEVLKFIGRMFGWSLQSSVVLSLQDFRERMGSQARPDPSRLLTMLSGHASRLAVSMPLPASPVGAPIERPAGAAFPSLLRPLHCSCEDDLRLLGDMFDYQSGQVACLDTSSSSGGVLMSFSGLSKLHNKLSVLITSAREILAIFSNEQCLESLRESTFTGILSKMMALQSTASVAGESPDVIGQAHHWTEGLQHCKTFAKVNREYTKANCKLDRLLLLFVPLQKTYEF
jgi:hypothetical protein